METKQGIQARICVGYAMTPEIQNGLSQSQLWQQRKSGGDGIGLIIYKGKEYIGCFLSDERPTVSQVREAGEKLRRQLQECCPDLPWEKYTARIFTQIFVS